MGKAFLKLDLEMMSAVGSDAAVLYALLKNMEKTWKKDERGYCLIWRRYLMETTGWGHSKLVRVRSVLIAHHLLDFIPGKNQNSPSKYKII